MKSNFGNVLKYITLNLAFRLNNERFRDSVGEIENIMRLVWGLMRCGSGLQTVPKMRKTRGKAALLL